MWWVAAVVAVRAVGVAGACPCCWYASMEMNGLLYFCWCVYEARGLKFRGNATCAHQEMHTSRVCLTIQHPHIQSTQSTTPSHKNRYTGCPPVVFFAEQYTCFVYIAALNRSWRTRTASDSSGYSEFAFSPDVRINTSLAHSCSNTATKIGRAHV